jgi:DNA-binding MarR family transcriptional regulator
MRGDLHALRDALIELTGLLNRPQQDDALLSAAGVDLERALFPLLVRLERRGSLGVVELADLSGRDYTTVSRQVTRLEELGLVRRRPGTDKRVHEAMVTAKGARITAALDAARDRMLTTLFAGWDGQDVSTLARLLGRLVAEAQAMTATVR